LDVKKETSRLVINAADLKIEPASLYSESLQQDYDLLIPVLDTTLERVIFELKATLPAGSKAQVRIPFNGKLTGSMIGYYRSSWDDNGKRRSYALTKFEVTFQKSELVLLYLPE
jgi:aminopeptidase 2